MRLEGSTRYDGVLPSWHRLPFRSQALHPGAALYLVMNGVQFLALLVACRDIPSHCYLERIGTPASAARTRLGSNNSIALAARATGSIPQVSWTNHEAEAAAGLEK